MRAAARYCAAVLWALLVPACKDAGPSLDGADLAPPGPPSGSYQGMLDIEIRNHLQVSLLPRDGGALAVSVSLVDGDFGLFAPATALTAEGRAEPFPEADLLLYTARLAAPPRQGGPCGDQPVSLGLSLSRRGSNVRVNGSLTAYCGAEHYAGVPARVLRVTGDLPRVP